jgi:hypothetical protein
LGGGFLDSSGNGSGTGTAGGGSGLYVLLLTAANGFAQREKSISLASRAAEDTLLAREAVYPLVHRFNVTMEMDCKRKHTARATTTSRRRWRRDEIEQYIILNVCW